MSICIALQYNTRIHIRIRELKIALVQSDNVENCTVRPTLMKNIWTLIPLIKYNAGNPITD